MLWLFLSWIIAITICHLSFTRLIFCILIILEVFIRIGNHFSIHFNTARNLSNVFLAWKHPSFALFPFIGTWIDCYPIYYSYWTGNILLVSLPELTFYFSYVEDHLSLGLLPPLFFFCWSTCTSNSLRKGTWFILFFSLHVLRPFF